MLWQYKATRLTSLLPLNSQLHHPIQVFSTNEVVSIDLEIASNIHTLYAYIPCSEIRLAKYLRLLPNLLLIYIFLEKKLISALRHISFIHYTSRLFLIGVGWYTSLASSTRINIVIHARRLRVLGAFLCPQFGRGKFASVDAGSFSSSIILLLYMSDKMLPATYETKTSVETLKWST